MGNKQSSEDASLEQQLQQKKLKKTKKQTKTDTKPLIKVEGFGSYFGHGQIVDKPANPMLSNDFDYPHRNKLCYYRDERLVMTKVEVAEIQLAVEQAKARSESRAVATNDAVTIPASFPTTTSANSMVPSVSPPTVSPAVTSIAPIASAISTPSTAPHDPTPTTRSTNSTAPSDTTSNACPTAVNEPQFVAAASTASDSPVVMSATKAAVTGGSASASDVQAKLNQLATGKPIKLIIDTDIGTDCDDVLALLTCLNMPAADVNLLGVTTCYHPTLLRKHVAHSILRAAGGRFAHIPVLAGPSRLCGTHRMFFHNGNEGLGLGLSEEEKAALWEEQKSNEAVEFLRTTVAAHPGEVVIAAIGTGTNIGLCGHRYADFEAQVGHIVFMGGGSVLTRGVWYDSWSRPHPPPFELPVHEGMAMKWLTQPEKGACKPIILFPNINVSNDTLGTSFMLSLKCPISLIPHYITAKHWLKGRPIETLLRLALHEQASKLDTPLVGVKAPPPEPLSDKAKHHPPHLDAFRVSGRLALEWFKTRHGQRGQCLHDPLTVYEAVYPRRACEGSSAKEGGRKFVPGSSCLEYVRGKLVMHSWAGYLTFVPDPQGLHRLAVSCVDADAWTNEWAGPTLIGAVPESECVDRFPGYDKYQW